MGQYVQYVLAGGGGAERYQQKFSWFNFRYITLNATMLGPGFVPGLGAVTAHRVGSDTTGSAHASPDHIGGPSDSGWCAVSRTLTSRTF